MKFYHDPTNPNFLTICFNRTSRRRDVANVQLFFAIINSASILRFLMYAIHFTACMRVQGLL